MRRAGAKIIRSHLGIAPGCEEKDIILVFGPSAGLFVFQKLIEPDAKSGYFLSAAHKDCFDTALPRLAEGHAVYGIHQIETVGGAAKLKDETALQKLISGCQAGDVPLPELG